MAQKKTVNPWLVYLLPLVWFVLGVVYARSLDAWAGIGVLILVIVSTIGLLAGVIGWHITKGLWQAVLIAAITMISVFTFVILLARIS